MHRDTTLNLPDASVRKREAHAAANRATMTAIVRSHLEAVTGDGSFPPRDDPLPAHSVGRMERAKRAKGAKRKRNAGELAMVGFMPSDDGLPSYTSLGDRVANLFEDAGVRVVNEPPNRHVLSTIGMLDGLGRVGVIVSAEEFVRAMTHPTLSGRKPSDARISIDLPDGIDEPAATGRSREPTSKS